MSIIFIDKRMPEPAKENLSNYGEVVEFAAPALAYPSISGHPDVFLAPLDDKVVMAPNIPVKYAELLDARGYSLVKGELPVGEKYPDTARYNVVVTDTYLIHNFRYTDSAITDRVGDRDLIHINQGYARCTLIGLQDNSFITSDEGIYRVLSHFKMNLLLVSPADILLDGHKHGFFGGTCGVKEDKFFVAGNLKHFGDGEKVRSFLENLGYDIVGLYDGPLFDGGGILFL